MSKHKEDGLPGNPLEAQGLLIKAVYKKFGADALPIIKDVLGKQGRALGLKIKKKAPDNRLSTIAEAFSKNLDPELIEVVSISDEKFRIKGFKCPLGLENTSRELCEAVMNIDHEYFRTAAGDRIELRIVKTLAAGDDCCDTVYDLKE